jgi:glutathione peroxidase
MRLLQLNLLLLTGVLTTLPINAFACPDFLNHQIRLLHSDKRINLCDQFAGRPLLVVNTASHCGYTYQFKALEQLHQHYKDQGLVVLGFPSDDFRQEADNEAETAKVCYVNYGVQFTLSAPVSVTGQRAHPLFLYLNAKAGEPQWNFYKYLISADGQQVERFSSQIEPDSVKLQQAIRRTL